MNTFEIKEYIDKKKRQISEKMKMEEEINTSRYKNKFMI